MKYKKFKIPFIAFGTVFVALLCGFCITNVAPVNDSPVNFDTADNVVQNIVNPVSNTDDDFGLLATGKGQVQSADNGSETSISGNPEIAPAENMYYIGADNPKDGLNANPLKHHFNLNKTTDAETTDVKWSLINGVLTISSKEGTPDSQSVSADYRPGWFEQIKTITSVQIGIDDTDIVKPAITNSWFSLSTSTEQYFEELNIATINHLDRLDLSAAQQTKFMFAGLGYKKTITINNGWEKINLSSDTDATAMFSITNIKAGFSSTEAVVEGGENAGFVNAYAMFQSAKGLTSISFDALSLDNLESASFMFNGADAVNITLGAVDVGKLTNALAMFCGCANLVTLDLSLWYGNVSSSNDFRNMFANSKVLETIWVKWGTDWSTELSPEKSTNMFTVQGVDSKLTGCNGTTVKDAGDTGKTNAKVDCVHTIMPVTKFLGEAGYLSAKCPVAVWNSSDKSLTYYYDGHDHNPSLADNIKVYALPENCSGENVPWLSHISTLETVSYDESFKDYDGLTSLESWYNNATLLRSVSGFNNVNLSNVESFDEMFLNCSGITGTLDLSNDTYPETASMNSTFQNCSTVSSINLTMPVSSEFTLSSGNYIFNGCSSLETIYVSDAWQPFDGEAESPFTGCDNNKLKAYDYYDDTKWVACSTEGAILPQNLRIFNWSNDTSHGYLTKTEFELGAIIHPVAEGAAAQDVVFEWSKGDEWSYVKVGASYVIENDTVTFTNLDGTKARLTVIGDNIDCYQWTTTASETVGHDETFTAHIRYLKAGYTVIARGEAINGGGFESLNWDNEPEDESIPSGSTYYLDPNDDHILIVETTNHNIYKCTAVVPYGITWSKWKDIEPGTTYFIYDDKEFVAQATGSGDGNYLYGFYQTSSNQNAESTLTIYYDGLYSFDKSEKDQQRLVNASAKWLTGAHGYGMYWPIATYYGYYTECPFSFNMKEPMSATKLEFDGTLMFCGEIKSMANWFRDFNKLETVKNFRNVNLAELKTNNPEDYRFGLDGIFQGCEVLKNMDLRNSTWPYVPQDYFGIKVSHMFYGCKELDLVDWRIHSQVNTKFYTFSDTFQYCQNLKSIYVTSQWTTPIKDSETTGTFGMFGTSVEIQQTQTKCLSSKDLSVSRSYKFDNSSQDKMECTMACAYKYIDGTHDQFGYFTELPYGSSYPEPVYTTVSSEIDSSGSGTGCVSPSTVTIEVPCQFKKEGNIIRFSDGQMMTAYPEDPVTMKFEGWTDDRGEEGMIEGSGFVFKAKFSKDDKNAIAVPPINGDISGKPSASTQGIIYKRLMEGSCTPQKIVSIDYIYNIQFTRNASDIPANYGYVSLDPVVPETLSDSHIKVYYSTDLIPENVNTLVIYSDKTESKMTAINGDNDAVDKYGNDYAQWSSMTSMFSNFPRLYNITGLDNIDTSACNSFAYTFHNCGNATRPKSTYSLDLSSWSVDNAQIMDYMFCGIIQGYPGQTHFSRIYVNEADNTKYWLNHEPASSVDMFANCANLVGEDWTGSKDKRSTWKSEYGSTYFTALAAHVGINRNAYSSESGKYSKWGFLTHKNSS